MSTKSKKAAASSSSTSRLTASSTTATAPPSSSVTPATPTVPTTTPSSVADQRCYCSDPRPLQSDLICSHNTAICYATHVSCLRDNDGNPFNSFLLGRSCFLCAHCVNRPSFRHPTDMECTLDSKYGCFYENKGFTKQREADMQAAAATTVAAEVGAGEVGEPTETREDKHVGEDSKEEAEAVEERDRTDGTQRMEDEEAEQTGNGHITHASRRSTRTSADKETTLAAAVVNSTTTPASWPAASHNHTSGVSSSATGDSTSAVTATAAVTTTVSGVDDESIEPKKAKRRGIRDTDKKAKGKLVPRCTSPSHFLTDDSPALASASNFGASAFSSNASSFASLSSSSSASASAVSLPVTSANSRHLDKLRTDALLSSISSMYYRPRLVHPNAADVYVSADYDRFEYPTVDALLSPLRKSSVLDDWTPLEVALFESGICSYGKDFHAISRLMAGRKTCGQCVEFYYVWKKSGHYAMWKEYGKPVRRRTDSKAEQWRAVEERMRGLSSRQDEDGAKRRRVEESEGARERESQRIGENGVQDKKVKMESSSGELQLSSAKMEDDSNASGGPKIESSTAGGVTES